MVRGLVVTLVGLLMTGCGSTAGGVNLWDAIALDDAAAIRRFHEAGGDVNHRSLGGSTPLWDALEQHKPYAYRALLECGADPNVIMSGKRVVTHWAAIEPDPEWLRLALEHGADPNLVNVGRGIPQEGPPLKFAIGMRGSLASVKLLVEHGADIDLPDLYNCYPLATAAQQTKYDIVLYLLEQGADYRRAECRGTKFLDRIKEVDQHIKHMMKLKFDRDQFEAVVSWLEAHGVDIRGG